MVEIDTTMSVSNDVVVPDGLQWINICREVVPIIVHKVSWQDVLPRIAHVDLLPYPDNDDSA